MIDTALILAAGRGSRLKEVTATRSKAMAPIAGKPIIGRVIESLKAAGISHCIVVGAPHDSELQSYCAHIPNTTLVFQEKPLGSANALQAAAGHTPAHFVVCACDSLIPSQDISNLIAHHSSNSSATLSIIEVDPRVSLSSRSVVAMRGDCVTDFIEKPSEGERISNFSALPLYVLTQEIFPVIAKLSPSPRGEYELPEVFRHFIRAGKTVRALRASERFDLTDQNDLLALNERFLAEISPSLQIDPSVVVPPSTRIVPPALIEKGVTIGEHCTLGPGIYLERDSTIASRCNVSHAVVLRGTHVAVDVTNKVVS